MHIDKIEYGPEKESFWSQVAFILIIILTLVAAGITGMIIWKIIFSDPSVASSRSFIEGIGKLLAYLLFVMAAILYLYVKGLLQDEYVTTLE
jgi:cytochrome b subunit of formate dehydrogenase